MSDPDIWSRRHVVSGVMRRKGLSLERLRRGLDAPDRQCELGASQRESKVDSPVAICGSTRGLRLCRFESSVATAAAPTRPSHAPLRDCP
jgi:hypothetical protein